jgi:hypothetical protein
VIWFLHVVEWVGVDLINMFARLGWGWIEFGFQPICRATLHESETLRDASLEAIVAAMVLQERSDGDFLRFVFYRDEGKR